MTASDTYNGLVTFELVRPGTDYRDDKHFWSLWSYIELPTGNLAKELIKTEVPGYKEITIEVIRDLLNKWAHESDKR